MERPGSEKRLGSVYGFVEICVCTAVAMRTAEPRHRPRSCALASTATLVEHRTHSNIDETHVNSLARQLVLALLGLLPVRAEILGRNFFVYARKVGLDGIQILVTQHR